LARRYNDNTPAFNTAAPDYVDRPVDRKGLGKGYVG
jgi:hypothetical protein